MADDVKPMMLIITNPMLSGRSFKMMVLARDPEGKFVHREKETEIALGDGQTTVVQLEPGSRLILREEHEPALSSEMANHPAMTGRRDRDEPGNRLSGQDDRGGVGPGRDERGNLLPGQNDRGFAGQSRDECGNLIPAQHGIDDRNRDQQGNFIQQGSERSGIDRNRDQQDAAMRDRVGADQREAADKQAVADRERDQREREAAAANSLPPDVPLPIVPPGAPTPIVAPKKVD